MIHPAPQEIIRYCDKMNIWEWVEWYNFRLKILKEQSHIIIIGTKEELN